MKKLSILLAILTSASLYPCTNILVGKKASASGATIVSYSADSYILYGELYHWPPAKHKAGEMLKVYEWDWGKFLGEIPQVAETYGVIGNMNQFQLTITETTFGGRKELADPNGILDYGSLIYITLQRAKNAREAIQVMTDLVARYGYYSSGESFSIADPNEIWILEMIGKGKDQKGAVWVAQRLPDDAVAAHANQARIRKFALNDPQNVLYAPDVISFAREKGYFSGKDEDFSFADAYAPSDFGARRFCEARVWSFFNHISKDAAKYADYAQGKDTEPMPLYLVPDRKISVRDVQAFMRDHYENTPLDGRYNIGAGAYESPYRFPPLLYKVNEQEYCHERPIATQQTGFTLVAEMRSWLPDAIGGVLWFGIDDASQTVYYPIYCNNTSVPPAMQEGNGDLVTFSWDAAFWVHNWVSNMVYSRYKDMNPDLQKVQKQLEDQFAQNQKPTEEQALKLYKKSPKKAIDFLTKYSNEQVAQGIERWKRLGEFLIVKYIDGVKKQEENGQFKRTQYGRAEYPDRPGYSPEFYQKIIHETGDKYKVPQEKKNQ